MAGSSEITKMATEESQQLRKGRSRSRDALVDINARLARVELAVVEGQEKFEEADQRIMELETGREELQGEMQGAVNVAVTTCLDQVKALEESLRAEIVGLKEEIARVVAELGDAKDELILCKRAIAQGGGVANPVVATTPSRVDVPKPKAYHGSRNAKEIDNFLWSLEQYFKALGLDEGRKVDHASLYLVDTAMVWWRRRCGDIERGTCTIDTWDEFKRELKRQFYPVNAEHEARAKLRRLTHEGSIRDYVKEFSEVLLEIPDYPDKEALFAFMDGLQHWAKLEIERRGAQDLATAISIAESLIEFKRSEKPKFHRDNGDNGKSGGDNHHSKESSHKYDKGKSIKDDKGGGRPPIQCFFCDGPHRARECPKKAKLSALVEEREEHERCEETRVGSLQLLSAMKSNIEMPKPERKGRLFVEAKVGQQTVKALVDTGASHNFLEVKEANRLGIKYDGKKGWLKSVNSEAKATFGVARGVKVSLGGWHGLVDFSVVPMDDYAIVLGMEFIDQVKAMLMPCTNTMCILDGGNACMVPLARETCPKAKRISSMQLIKEEILPEFPKGLPPMGEVDGKIEPSPCSTANRMAPPEFGELRRKSKANVICPRISLGEQDPEAKKSRELASRGKTSQNWLRGGELTKERHKVPSTVKFAKGGHERPTMAQAHQAKAKRKKWAEAKKRHSKLKARDATRASPD